MSASSSAPGLGALAPCRICMIRLMRSTYKRHWWFVFIREPLVWGMRFLAFVNRLPVKSYAAANPECRGCLRFIKADLTVKSPVFRFLSRFIEPKFKALRDPRLVPEEVEQAKEYAAEMMKTLPPADTSQKEKLPSHE